MNKPNLYAFWKYDQFPFVLGAECHDNGRKNKDRVFVPSYCGYMKPFKVVSLEEGEEIQRELNMVKALREDFLRTMNKLCSNQLETIMERLK